MKAEKHTIKFIREKERIAIRSEQRKEQRREDAEKRAKAKRFQAAMRRKIRNPGVGKVMNKYLVGKRMTVKLGG